VMASCIVIIVGCSSNIPMNTAPMNAANNNMNNNNNSASAATASSDMQSTVQSNAAGQNNKISQSELARHNTEIDCWVSYQGAVYDITSYVPMHPGGASRIIPLCGTSSEFEQAFNMQHGTKKVATLEKMGAYKGELNG
jgi:cytochrome b involved in lipid metabolism